MGENAMRLLRAYMGNGLLIVWFLLALLYLFWKEKRRPVRILFVYVPVLVLLLFFNPLVGKILYAFIGDEIYYRILWLLPMTVVTSYAAVRFAGRLAGLRRYLFAGLAAVAVMLGGSYIYGNFYFREAENRYHVPDSVVEICDAIVLPGREVMAAFPEEMLHYVRQYTPYVRMPYGREVFLYGDVELSELMRQQASVEAEELARLLREAACHYVILREGMQMTGDLTDYGYELFGKTAGYVIYRDPTQNFETR